MSDRVNRSLVFLALAVAAGCGKDSTAPVNPDPGTGFAVPLKGTLATPTYSGEIDITIAATPGLGGTADIDGCVYLQTANCVMVAGNYTVGSKTLTFVTNNPALTFQGSYVNGVAEGTVTGDGGDGVFTTRTQSPTVFCGTFTGTVDGTWNTVVGTTAINGAFVNQFGNSGLISGTRSGNNVSATGENGLTASGTISVNTASGTWTLGTDTGTWSGSTAECRDSSLPARRNQFGGDYRS